MRAAAICVSSSWLNEKPVVSVSTNHDVAVEIAEIASSAAIAGQRRVPRRGRPAGRAIAYKGLQDTMRLLAVLFHNDQPTISQLFAQTETPLPG